MPPDPPDLVLHEYKEILNVLQLRIPGYTPEWTDWNESDPGTTLLELFAWLGESMGYRLNQVPAACYRKFVELIGQSPRPAQPSIVYLSFTPTSATPTIPIVVPKGTAVSGTGTDGKPVYFETDDDLGLTRFPLRPLQYFDGSPHGIGDAPFTPFGAAPSPGSAVYLGCGPADPSVTQPPFPEEIQLHVVVPATSGGAARADQAAALPVPPVTVQWEYLDRTQPAEHWTRLNQYQDGSVAFTRTGDIHLEGPPAQIQAQPNIGGHSEPYFWIRCRLTGGAYPAGSAPVVEQIQANTVSATSLRTVTGEPVGQSSGLPDQQFTLANAPVDRPSIALTVTAGEE